MHLSRITRKKLGLLSLFDLPCACKSINTVFLITRKGSTSLHNLENEIKEKAIYPEILPNDSISTYRRERDKQLLKMQKLESVEEKLIGINMPRYYGWNSLILKEGNCPFNFLPFVQHVTRTDLIDVDRFPFSSNLTEIDISNIVQKIRPQLQSAIFLEVSKRRYLHEFDGRVETMGEGELSDEVTKGVVEQINRVLFANLTQNATHLYDTEIDYEPRMEAFWRVGGFYPDQETYDERKKDKKNHEKELKTNRFAKRKIEEDPEDVVGHFIQYLGKPILQLRGPHPLRVLQIDTKQEPDLSLVPVVKYDPSFYGLEKIRRHGTNIPGFWPGDPNEFGILSYHSCGHLHGRPPSFGEEDITHTISAQGILAGYAWLLAQANYQGFSTFHDITYPLTTTTIITDGKSFTFFASQLNTLLLHDEFIDTNPKVNVCYRIPTLQLYEKIEGSEFIGWNDQVLSLLIQAYVNPPEKREGVNLKPYVSKEVPFVKDIKHEERRSWLHKNFRHLFSNRPRHRLDRIPEIYDWEKIYKIKFDTRPMDAKRRFFELGIDPWKRRLNEHAKEYIPRFMREPANRRKKFRDTFWPDC